MENNFGQQVRLTLEHLGNMSQTLARAGTTIGSPGQEAAEEWGS